MVVVQPKILPCIFLNDILCSFRKTEKFAIMDRCLRCRYYREFLLEMQAEDEAVMDEIDRMREFELYG